MNFPTKRLNLSKCLTLAGLLFGCAVATAAPETEIYKKTETGGLKLLIEKPADWKASDKRPAVVFFFGGGWVGGSPEQFRIQSEHFAKRGLVGVRVEYRVIPKGDKGPPDVCAADAKSAIRYVRANAAKLGIDPARIAGAGGSAGGHLAALTAMVPGLDDPADDLAVSCKPDALILFNPVFDNGPGEWGHQRVGAKFRQYSPAHNLTKGAPPTIVFLGDSDDLIPVAVAERFQAKMKEVESRFDLHISKGAKHGFFNKEPHRGETLGKADAFLVSLGWLEAAAEARP
jgi:acetyl esterase/lipase